MRPLNSAFKIGNASDTIGLAPLPSKEFSRLIDRISLSISDPLLKLRFINAALERYHKTCRLMGVPKLNDIICKQILVELVDRLLPGYAIDFNHPALAVQSDSPARTPWSLHAPWLVLLSALVEQVVIEALDYIIPSRKSCSPSLPSPATAGMPSRPIRILRGPLVALLLLLTVLSYAAFRRQIRPSVHAQTGLVSVRPESTPERAARSVPVATASTDAAKPTLNQTAAAPSDVWLVEKKPGYEFYSNGLRISTEHEVAGEPRLYRTIARADGLLSESKHLPIGLLYHTSEGDVIPFQSAYNRSLAQHSRELLYYIKQNRHYHYLIDRFGRVYRLVPDDAVAYHAGFSIWGDESDIFIMLNQSFIGICFEGRWAEPKGPAPAAAVSVPGPRVITRAQVDAGRKLTDLLRLRYQIADRNCVTHGLASINPQRYLIGHHLDWATDFPFGEMGLSDKYQLPLPSIVEFGFAYDQYFLQIMGKPWPGIDLAMEQLKAQAERENISYETLKRKLNQRFENQLARVRGKPLSTKDARREAWTEEEGPPQGAVSSVGGQP